MKRFIRKYILSLFNSQQSISDMTTRSEIPAAEKADLIELLTMDVIWKINMLLKIKTCENFIEVIGYSIWVIPFKFCSPINLEIRQKIDLYRFEAYTGRQRKHWTNCFRYVHKSFRTFWKMAEDENQFWIGQKLDCLHLLLCADKKNE